MNYLMFSLACFWVVTSSLLGATPRSYGGFFPKQKLTAIITKKSTFSASPDGVIVDVVLPRGIPNFNVGQVIVLTVDNKGGIQMAGAKLPFSSEYYTYGFGMSSPLGDYKTNLYRIKPTASQPRASETLIIKYFGVPQIGASTFFLSTGLRGAKYSSASYQFNIIGSQVSG